MNNPLSAFIDAAITHAVASNPKLFDPKKLERAPEVLARDALKFMTRSTKEGEAEAQAEAESLPFEWLPADSDKGKAYINLRSAAGCIARHTVNPAGAVCVPRAANNVSVWAFATMPAPAEWKRCTKAQQTAWHDFFELALDGANRRPIGDATLMPWMWPPSKEGQVYPFDTQEELPAP